MLKRRIIPCLLLKDEALVKTIQFNKFSYIGDPINAVKIYNDCEVDELIILDISATTEGKKPNISLIKKIVDECFIPLAYGGGVKTIEQMEQIFQIGVEKISLNSLLFENPEVVRQAVAKFGAQAIIASIDCKKNIWGSYEVFLRNGKVKVKMKFDEVLMYIDNLGIGEILINDIQRDGEMKGYNIELIKMCMERINVPVIGLGGAGNLEHLREAFKTGVPALAAGSLFVYKSEFRGVLINYPNKEIEHMR